MTKHFKEPPCPPPPAGRSGWRGDLVRLACLAGAVLAIWLCYHALEGYGDAKLALGGHSLAPPEGYRPPAPWGCLPFGGLLLSIALLPLIPQTSHWWEHNGNRLLVSLGFAAAALAFYMWLHPMTFSHSTGKAYSGQDSVVYVLEHALVWEYVPFMTLLFSLFVIAGGISLRGDLPAHPTTNTAFLAAGTVLASLLGTTGASMLLIRPLLQTNSERRHVVHTVIFFIFLVSNAGGCLLPTGDPPLFLGFLRGVPFLWTLSLWKEWLFVSATLLVVYFIWDCRAYRKETVRGIRRDEGVRKPLTLRGAPNIVLLLCVLPCAAFVQPGKPVPWLGFEAFPFLRELLMLALVGVSLTLVDQRGRRENQFDYHAILEVAALFLGIFICMQVPVEILQAQGSRLGLTEPWQFFWATGALSSFLDNAPTYVVFFTTADSLTHQPGPGVLTLLGGQFVRESLLTAVSLGAVFMGANTYIGNGPNFMVKSIAERSGVRMPSFFGYMAYSGLILLPLWALVTWLFLV